MPLAAVSLRPGRGFGLYGRRRGFRRGLWAAQPPWAWPMPGPVGGSRCRSGWCRGRWRCLCLCCGLGSHLSCLSFCCSFPWGGCLNSYCSFRWQGCPSFCCLWLWPRGLSSNITCHIILTPAPIFNNKPALQHTRENRQQDHVRMKVTFTLETARRFLIPILLLSLWHHHRRAKSTFPRYDQERN